jgi:outer membrane lipoprotein carrier protein
MRFIVVIFVCLFGPLSNFCWGLEATDILERVHERYVQADFQADFYQEAHLKAMDMVDMASGHLYFKPPGMMRWQYQVPEEFLIIVDSEFVWLYRPADKQVMTGRAQDYLGGEGSTDYFSNPKELSKEFTVELVSEASGKQEDYRLKLVPRTKRADLVELRLFVSKESFDITRAITVNSFGDQTTLSFSAYRFNQGLDPSLFAFQVPKGVEVIQLQDQF